MNYCPVCNNLLIPKDNKLVCRICKAEYQLIEDKDKAHKILQPINTN